MPDDAGSEVPGQGAWHGAPDEVDFAAGTELPRHFVHVRSPVEANYVVSPEGREGELQLVASQRSLSTKGGGNLTEGTTFVGRRQVDKLFTFSVDIEFEPILLGEEAGVSVYLDETRHLDLGVMLAENGERFVGLKAFSSNNNATAPAIVTAALQGTFGNARLEIRAENTTHYAFYVGTVVESGNTSVDAQVVGFAAVSPVSGGYTETLLGAYATTNGAVGNHIAVAYVSRWRYQGQGQEVDEGVIV